MKITNLSVAIALMCFVGVAVGCATGLSFDQAWENYRSIVPGMTEKEVFAKIGEPTVWKKDHIGHWETTRGGDEDLDYVALDVAFDSDGRVLARRPSSGHRSRWSFPPSLFVDPTGL